MAFFSRKKQSHPGDHSQELSKRVQAIVAWPSRTKLVKWGKLR